MEVQTRGGDFLVACTPVLDKKGAIEKLSISTEITERKRLEKALQEK
jgi:hypothetical protein